MPLGNHIGFLGNENKGLLSKMYFFIDYNYIFSTVSHILI